MPPKKPAAKKTVEALSHDEAKRKNIPTAEYQSVLQKNEQEPVKVSYPRRARDLLTDSGSIFAQIREETK